MFLDVLPSLHFYNYSKWNPTLDFIANIVGLDDYYHLPCYAKTVYEQPVLYPTSQIPCSHQFILTFSISLFIIFLLELY